MNELEVRRTLKQGLGITYGNKKSSCVSVYIMEIRQHEHRRCKLYERTSCDAKILQVKKILHAMTIK